MKFGKIFWILLIILLVGTTLRLYKLDADGIWYDEASSVAMSLNDLNAYFFFNSLICKPIYFLLLRFWIYATGLSEFWLRLPSVIFTIISFFIIYLIGKDVVNNKVGLLASFLLSISCFHIYHSQQVRQFTLEVLLTLCSFLYFIRILKENNTRYYKFNTFFNLLLFFTHPYTLTIIITQNISILLLKWKDKLLKKRWFFYQRIVLFFILFWFIISNKSVILHNTWWIPKPDLSIILETFQTFCYGGPRYGLDDFKIIFELSTIIWVTFFLYSFFFIIGLFAKHNKNHFFFSCKSLLTLWLFTPIMISFFASFFRPVYLIKHLIIVLPAYYIIVAVGIDKLKSKSTIFFVLVLLLLFSFYPLKIMYSKDFNTHWKQASLYLKRNITKDDIIFISTNSEIIPFLFYFSSSAKFSFRDFDTDAYAKLVNGKLHEAFYENSNLIIGVEQNEGEGVDFVEDDLKKKVNKFLTNVGDRNIWLTVSRWTGIQEKKIIIEYLENIFDVSERKEFLGVDVYKFIKDETFRD